MRPLELWKSLSPDVRLAAADALWRDEHGAEQQVEAIVLLSRRLNFRPKSLQSLPVERRAKMLAQAPDVSEAIAMRSLIAYHFANERPMMVAFLDALGIAHEGGLITEENVPAPDGERLKTAVSALRAAFPPAGVDLYLKTLTAIDPETWGSIPALA